MKFCINRSKATAVSMVLGLWDRWEMDIREEGEEE